MAITLRTAKKHKDKSTSRCARGARTPKAHVATLPVSLARGLIIMIVVVVVAAVDAAAAAATSPLSTDQVEEMPLPPLEVRLLELPGVLVVPRFAEAVDVELCAPTERYHPDTCG